MLYEQLLDLYRMWRATLAPRRRGTVRAHSDTSGHCEWPGGVGVELMQAGTAGACCADAGGEAGASSQANVGSTSVQVEVEEAARLPPAAYFLASAAAKVGQF